MSEPSYSTFVLVPIGQTPTLDAVQTALDLYFADEETSGVKERRVLRAFALVFAGADGYVFPRFERNRMGKRQ